jgi:UDPglucose--hexose-1-phosphate uridylyltransferase
MPELRKDPLLGRWVIIGTERVRRPADFATPPRRRRGPCILCAGHERETPPEVLLYRDRPEGGAWRVRVVPSRFPALRVEGDLERRGHGLYDLMNGIGAHEVVIESPRHDDALADLPVAAIEDVVRAWRDRILDLKRDQRFRSIVVFKAHRVADRGAAGDHAQSQLLATPIPSQALNDELHHARAYHDYRERCLFCDILHQEAEERARVVLETEHVLAFAPFAARVPFETWLVPRRHAPAFEHGSAAELRDLARGLRGVLRGLDRTLGDPPFEFLLHSAPFADTESPYYHWHLEVTPRLPSLDGTDRGSGFAVNPMPPEDAARLLREVLD